MTITGTTTPITIGREEGEAPISWLLEVSAKYYNSNNSQDGITTDTVLTDTHPPEANRPQNMTVPPPPLQSNLTEAMSIVSKLSVQSMPLGAL